MSEPRPVEATVVVDPSNTKSDDFSNLTKEQKKARLATVLDRGMTADRLHVNLPDDLYGEWVPADDNEIVRMQGMGFELDNKYAPKRALHGGGTGEARVGDVVFMTTNRETKELIDEIRREKYIEVHGKPGSESIHQQREEREFNAASKGTEGITGITESSTARADAAALREALQNKEE